MCGISLALYILAIVYKIIIFIIALERKVIMKNKYNILEDQPIKVILFFSIPVLLGLFFQQIYTTVDTVIVSKTLGQKALAATGCLNYVNFLILGFCNGMASGFSIPIAQIFGSGDEKKLKKYLGNIIWVYLFFAIVITVISVCLTQTILIVTNTPKDIFSMAYIYMLVIFLGIPTQFAYNTLSGIMRSLGDVKTPLYILIGCSLLNVGLDLIFIMILHLGVFGAALATVLSEALSAIGCLVIMYKQYTFIHLTKDDVKINKTCIIELLKDGIPMGLQMSICGIGSLLLQSSVNALGSVYVASVTASERIWQILQSVTAAIGTSLTVYCGQNIGANKITRVKQGVRAGVIMAMIYCFVSSLFIYFFRNQIVSIFIDKDALQLIQLTKQYLVINALFFWAQGLIHTVRFSLQGMGYARISLLAAILEMIARAVTGLFIVPLFGYIAVCFSNALAWVLASTFIVVYYLILIKKMKEV